MSIFDRLEDVIKSYLNSEDDRIFGKSRNSNPRGDPDLDAAYDELNDYLNKDKGRSSAWSDEAFGNKHDKTTDEARNGGYNAYTDYVNEEFAKKQSERRARRNQEQAQMKRDEHPRNAHPKVPETLRKDFSELGLAFASGLAECKTAYKKLLKKHHPDRHVGHEGNMKKATEKSARINVSYRRIEAWYVTGKVD